MTRPPEMDEGIKDWWKKIFSKKPPKPSKPSEPKPVEPVLKVNQKLTWGGGLQKYQSGIRKGIYGLWSGKMDAQDAFMHLWVVIERGIMQAWYNGAMDCGIRPEELSQIELRGLQDAIYNEMQYLEKLIYDVMERNKASGTQLKTLNTKINMWSNRYNQIRNKAKALACGNKKLKWILGPTKVHCVDCAKLNGKVKRASTWVASGWMPQGKMLACKGYQCLCSLVVTTDPLSPGKLPNAAGGE
jgi:hypothetical protein